MASFKLNLARIQNCPAPAAVAEALEAFGLPETEEYGVLNHSATSEAVFATIIRKTQTAVQRLDEETHEVLSAAVEKVTVYPFAVKPSSEVLEIYSGSASGIEQVGAFFASCLQFPTLVEAIEVDIPAALDKLLSQTRKFQLRAVRVSEYAHNSYMSGPYTPKFLDTQHGMEFIEQYADFVASASVRFATQSGRANVKLAPKACFSFSCNEEDTPEVQSVLRKLI